MNTLPSCQGGRVAAMVRMGSRAPSTAPSSTSRPTVGSIGSSANAFPSGVRAEGRERLLEKGKSEGYGTL